MHWAAKYGSNPTVRLLVHNGVNLNAVDRWGRTALIWAVENMQRAVVKMLLKSGADVEAKSRHGLTALHAAAFMGFESAVQCLLEGGACVETRTQHNLTALHIAAFMGWESVVLLLLQEGADIEAEAQWCGDEDVEECDDGAEERDAVEKSLNSLLHWWSSQQATVQLHGLTVRQLADTCGHLEVQLLLGCPQPNLCLIP